MNYLIEQFKAAGLQPGNPDGTWMQKVPLVGFTPHRGPLVVRRGGKTRGSSPATKSSCSASVSPTSQARELGTRLCRLRRPGAGAPVGRFQGPGRQGQDPHRAGERSAGPEGGQAGGSRSEDVRRQGDDVLRPLDLQVREGRRLGAAGVLIVHETIPAGYPFSVVQGMGGERFDLVTPDKNAGRAAIEGWMSLDAATALLKMAGQDYQKLKAQATTRDFKPVPLGVTASIAVKQKTRTLDSQNVIARLHGQRPGAEERVRRLHRALGSPRHGRAGGWRHHLQRRARQCERLSDGARDRARFRR